MMVLGPIQPTGAVRKAAQGLISFINASPTPYHAAMEASVRLEKAGFHRLREEDEWNINPGGRYYLTRYAEPATALHISHRYTQESSRGPCLHGAEGELLKKSVKKCRNLISSSDGVQEQA